MRLATTLKIVALIIFVAGAFCLPVRADSCPRIEVSCPDAVLPGKPVTFVANLVGADPEAKYTFKWTVSAGTITSGQDTSAITVATTGLTTQRVTATVEVGGMPDGCGKTASCSSRQMDGRTLPQMIDGYGNVSFNDEEARLDAFALQLRNTPGARAYIIFYGGRVARPHFAQTRAERAKRLIVGNGRIDAARIVILDGGYREELIIEFWIVPSGSIPPSPSPTVDPGEVKFVKNVKPKPRPRPRAKP